MTTTAKYLRLQSSVKDLKLNKKRIEAKLKQRILKLSLENKRLKSELKQLKQISF